MEDHIRQLEHDNINLKKRLADLQNEEDERESRLYEEKLEQKLAMGRIKQELLEQKRANILLIDENQFLKNNCCEIEKKHMATMKILESNRARGDHYTNEGECLHSLSCKGCSGHMDILAEEIKLLRSKISELNSEILIKQLEKLPTRQVSVTTQTEPHEITKTIPVIAENPHRGGFTEALKVDNTSPSHALEIFSGLGEPTAPAVPSIIVTPPTPAKYPHLENNTGTVTRPAKMSSSSPVKEIETLHVGDKRGGKRHRRRRKRTCSEGDKTDRKSKMDYTEKRTEECTHTLECNDCTRIIDRIIDRYVEASNETTRNHEGVNSVKPKPNVHPKSSQQKKKIMVVGSSNARDIARFLSDALPNESYAVTGTCIPNGTLEQVMNTTQASLQKLGKDDCAVIIAGFNDVVQGNMLDLSAVNSLGKKTNVLLSEIRLMHKSKSKTLNWKITQQNKLINSNASYYRVIPANLVVGINENLTTRDGVHLNRTGKRMLTRKVKEMILNPRQESSGQIDSGTTAESDEIPPMITWETNVVSDHDDKVYPIMTIMGNRPEDPSDVTPVRYKKSKQRKNWTPQLPTEISKNFELSKSPVQVDSNPMKENFLD